MSIQYDCVPSTKVKADDRSCDVSHQFPLKLRSGERYSPYLNFHSVKVSQFSSDNWKMLPRRGSPRGPGGRFPLGDFLLKNDKESRRSDAMITDVAGL